MRARLRTGSLASLSDEPVQEMQRPVQEQHTTSAAPQRDEAQEDILEQLSRVATFVSCTFASLPVRP